jgi:hypothetical protein
MVDISEPVGVRTAGVARSATVTRRGIDFGGALRTVDFTDRQIAGLFVVLTVITVIPVIFYPWPPLADYINHLSRMHIIATMGSDPDLSKFYDVNWQIIPNLMMDIIVPPLQRLMSVYAAGQIYTIVSFLLIIGGTLALNRQLFGRWSVLPLIAFPLLYNNVFLVGTMNYIFGMGLALWAMTAWVRLREHNPVIRLTVSLLFVLALFFCHLFAVGVYGLALAAFETSRLIEQYRARGTRASAASAKRWLLADFVATGLPFLPVLPLLMMSPTWGLRGSFVWELNGKLDGLLYVVEVYSHSAALLLTGIVFETYMADQRLPISLAFMVIACAHLNLGNDYVRRGFATVLVLLLAIRVFEVQSVWADASKTIVAFRDSVRLIDRGSKILVAYADPEAGDDTKDLVLVHAACTAIIERSALVTTAFTVKGKQILEVREPYRGRVDRIDGTPPSMAQLLQVAEEGPQQDRAENYWNKWTTDYDYVYVLFTDSSYENPDPTRLTAVYTGDRFALFRINPVDTQPGPKVADGRTELRPAR